MGNSPEVKSLITGEKIGDVYFSTAEDVSMFISASAISISPHIIDKLKEILNTNLDSIANLLTHEIGKPLTQCKSEIRKALDFIDYSSNEIPNKEIFGNLLILGSMAAPIWELTFSLCKNLKSYKKIVFKPSTKVANTINYIYSKLTEESGVADTFLVANLEKEELDELLEKENFEKIIKFSRTKLKKKGLNIEDLSNPDKFLMVDESSDLDVLSGVIIDNIFNFENFNLSRIQHIFIDKTIYSQFLNKLISKLDLNLIKGNVNEPNVNFSDIFKSYKRKNFKEFILKSISLGADIEYGSVEETINSPLLMKVNSDMKEIFEKNLWAPIIFLVPYSKILDLPKILKPFKNYEGISFLSHTNYDFVSKRIGIEFKSYS